MNQATQNEFAVVKSFILMTVFLLKMFIVF